MQELFTISTAAVHENENDEESDEKKSKEKVINVMDEIIIPLVSADEHSTIITSRTCSIYLVICDSVICDYRAWAT